MAIKRSETSNIVFHNRKSSDFGMKLLFPFNPPSPAPDQTPIQVPGASGDLPVRSHSVRAVEAAINAVIHIPHRYTGWGELRSDIEHWLYGQEDWLKFDREPEYLYKAVLTQAPTFTPVSPQRINATLNFHFQPYKYRAKTIHWRKLDDSMVMYQKPVDEIDTSGTPAVQGTFINDETENVYPDWHLRGTGNFMLHVNGFPYEFDNLNGDIYLLGDRGNAYSADPRDNPSEIQLLNGNVQLANNWSPQLLCRGKGENTIALYPLDTDSKLEVAEFIPKLRRLV